MIMVIRARVYTSTDPAERDDDDAEAILIEEYRKADSDQQGHHTTSNQHEEEGPFGFNIYDLDNMTSLNGHLEVQNAADVSRHIIHGWDIHTAPPSHDARVPEIAAKLRQLAPNFPWPPPTHLTR